MRKIRKLPEMLPESAPIKGLEFELFVFDDNHVLAVVPCLYLVIGSMVLGGGLIFKKPCLHAAPFEVFCFSFVFLLFFLPSFPIIF